ncbi:hypothetical protein TWF694_001724 [Orbilia ellipsospora]|uniref:Uncharacterized protein n=1 Tax=Orbilia ellipsospora TaxID=2528407 RepID=A0AAV9X4K1_9PEZI
MTEHLWSHDAWLQYYESKAADFSVAVRSNHAALTSNLESTCDAALSNRAMHLRDSDSYHGKKLMTAASGLIPFAKIAVSVAVAEKFANEALRAFGLRDSSGLENLAQKLKSLTGRDSLAWDLIKAFAKHSAEDMLKDAGTHAATEAVHLKPVIGQIISVGSGYRSSRKRLIKIIDKTRSWAEEIHKGVLVPLAVEKAL